MSTPAGTETTELARSYRPEDHEAEILRRWDAARVTHAGEPGDARPPYCIVIPPPNVTAALHLGHAFNNTLQDVLIRVHRMRGFDALWMPGTDHAGIATQTVVEKRLLAQGKRRTDFDRDDFVARVQEWKDEYEETITGQLRGMGCSCDWERRRFTMDEPCAAAVRTAFFRLFRDGLVYRGKRLVNWDPVTRTALADDEVEMREVEGSFWYLRYPIVDDAGRDTDEHVVVATTRPETMLGDVAVAVNPDDPERAPLVGKRVRVPLADRIVPIVADDYVVRPDPDSDDAKARFASGFLKVTPAHDANDWEIGVRHGLPVINVMGSDASISDRHGWEDVAEAARPFIGMSREEARKAIIARLDALGLLAETRPYRHSVGHSYRSHVPIEPWLSDQWYVRVSDDRLVGEAQRALAAEQRDAAPPPRGQGPAERRGDGELRFHPARYARTYEAWHASLRDWCISRQLWWGHRIPVWSRTIESEQEADAILARLRSAETAQPERLCLRRESTDAGTLLLACIDGEDAPELVAEIEAAGLLRDEDVLDTWFSSGLWPLSTMGWPDPDRLPGAEGLLERFNPTDVLCTGRDIITLWVSRMVMFNRYFNEGRVPFRDVYINPMIQDGHGQRMSKSLGNGVDPRDIIHSHGADAMRFTLVQMATSTQDVRLPVDMVSPWSDETFHPAEITSPAGYRVAAPTQRCPKTGKALVSGYGAASGLAQPSDDAPLARNTSAKFDLGRNFCNKLWNAVRFGLRSIAEGTEAEASSEDLLLADRWILARLVRTIRAIDGHVAEYQFNAVGEALYDFVWRDLCDWYLEAAKPTIAERPAQRRVLRSVLDAALRLLHPIVPFVTEALWPHLAASGPAGLPGLPLPPAPLLAGAAWPTADDALLDAEAEARFARAQELVNAIRAERAARGAKPRAMLRLLAPAGALALIADAQGAVETLAGLERVDPLPAERPAGAVPLIFESAELLLIGLSAADGGAGERDRLEKLIAEKMKAVETFRSRLSNAGYVSNAPPHLVEETRRLCADAESELAAARTALEAL